MLVLLLLAAARIVSYLVSRCSHNAEPSSKHRPGCGRGPRAALLLGASRFQGRRLRCGVGHLVERPLFGLYVVWLCVWLCLGARAWSYLVALTEYCDAGGSVSTSLAQNTKVNISALAGTQTCLGGTYNWVKISFNNNVRPSHVPLTTTTTTRRSSLDGASRRTLASWPTRT